MSQLEPVCGSCHRRHRIDLRCWRGRYAARRTRHVLATKGTTCWLHLQGCTLVATEADHELPRSHGGDDSEENLLPSCRHCNARRGNAANPFKPDAPVTPAGVGLSPRWRRG